MEKEQKWVDKKFKFELSQDNYDSILTQLRATPVKISLLVSSLPEDILSKRVDDNWSIKENVGHLIDLEELHEGRIDDFIDGKEVLRSADLKNKKTEEADHNHKNIEGFLEQFRKVRENFVNRLKELDEKVLANSSIHPRLNQPMRPIDMAQFVLEHDKHHIQTIKELINNT
jgi:uncharacterized damage-inducible protein DinB